MIELWISVFISGLYRWWNTLESNWEMHGGFTGRHGQEKFLLQSCYLVPDYRDRRLFWSHQPSVSWGWQFVTESFGF